MWVTQLIPTVYRRETKTRIFCECSYACLAVMNNIELAVPAPFAPVVSDETAVRRLDALRQREPAAWSALFEENRDAVFRAALAQVRDRDLAEDITGQVFLEAIQGIRRYRDRGAPLVAWLLAIARHRSVDALRKRRREERTGLPPEQEPALTVNPALAVLGELTSEQREVIHLRFVEDLSIAEVAQLTGRSAGSVKSLQHRALRQLRAQLSPTHPGRTDHG